MGERGIWWRFLTVVLAAGVVVGCGGPRPETKAQSRPTTSSSVPDPDDGLGDPIPDEPEPTSGPSTEFTTVTDPVNGAFSVDLPVDWDNLVYSTVNGQDHREVVNSVSPDGETVIFMGDPKLPSYWDPDQANDVTRQMAEWVSTMELASYMPAPEYFEKYVREKFGQLESFEVDGLEAKPTVEQTIRDRFAANGAQIGGVDAVDVTFSFKDEDGRENHAIVSGVTLDFGFSWMADVGGLATTGSVEDYTPMLSSMSKSKKTLQSFIDSQNQRHEQTMAMIQQRTEEMTRQHEANMGWIQDSANAHQQRMQSIWAAGDASISSFYDRMNSGDVEHRQFLNSINEESTVQNSEGRKFQVDNSYQRYWMNKNDNTYVGGDVNFGDAQLRELGLNPNDYQEVPVIKG